MIPSKVRFTGLELDPDHLKDRWHRGVIPLDWNRVRFSTSTDVPNVITYLNRWLSNNVEGRWSVWVKHLMKQEREINLAFEYEHDAVAFVLSDAKHEAFK